MIAQDRRGLLLTLASDARYKVICIDRGRSPTALIRGEDVPTSFSGQGGELNMCNTGRVMRAVVSRSHDHVDCNRAGRGMLDCCGCLAGATVECL